MPHEFLVRGRASGVRSGEVRDEAAAEWSFDIDDGYALYDLSIDHATLRRAGQRRRLATGLHLMAAGRLIPGPGSRPLAGSGRIGRAGAEGLRWR